MNRKTTNRKIMDKEKTLWITRTAVFIALLVVLQAVTAALGNTIVTGSVVNMLLILSVMTCGLLSGVTVAVLSPILAKFVGIGSFWSLIPFIVAGNITLVLIWHFIGNYHRERKKSYRIAALVTAAVAKYLVLYVGIVQVAIPLLLHLAKPQAAVISAMFSIPQLITALLGGSIALLILSPLKKAVFTDF